MSSRVVLSALIFAATAGGCATIPAVGGGMSDDERGPMATVLRVQDSPWRVDRIAVLESLPPQFVLYLTRDMPTPGWTISVDSLRVEMSERRIVAEVSETAPGGTAVQMIAPATLQLRLGALEAGRYVLELRARRGADPVHYLTQAIVLEAANPVAPVRP